MAIVLGTVILDACGLTSAKNETAIVLTVAGIFYTSIAMLMSAINTVHKREREKTTGSVPILPRRTETVDDLARDAPEEPAQCVGHRTPGEG
jgi:hypothetical protein